jgi:putative transposase
MTVLKAKSSAWIKKKTKKIPPGSFWSRGYFVSTIGINEIMVSEYIRNQRNHHHENQGVLPLGPTGGV